MSLVIFSIVTFSGSILLPLIVANPEEEKAAAKEANRRRFTPRPSPMVAGLLSAVEKSGFPKYLKKPDLNITWLVSHLIFAVAMIMAPFVRSVHFATVLVSLAGMYVFLLRPSNMICHRP